MLELEKVSEDGFTVRGVVWMLTVMESVALFAPSVNPTVQFPLLCGVTVQVPVVPPVAGPVSEAIPEQWLASLTVPIPPLRLKVCALAVEKTSEDGFIVSEVVAGRLTLMEIVALVLPSVNPTVQLPLL
jgi:hypothetical protein